MSTTSNMTPEQIDAAETAGIISAAQADAMRRDYPNENAALIGNEDEMRFVRSISDVFISLGIALLATGTLALCKLLGGGVVYLFGAATIWIMTEYFGRKKKAHLPTLLLALAFLVFVHRGLGDMAPANLGGGVFAAAITLIAMVAFYIRFKLPFSIALIAIACVILMFSLVGNALPFGLLLIISGLILFSCALYYDTKDTDRLTRFADNAFWLHFTAAPLIIHGLALYVLSLEQTTIFGVIPMIQLERTDAALMLGVIFILALIGLAINRRALLVSSLGYAAFAIGMLFKDTGLSIPGVLTATLLLLGAGIVFLGTGWHAARGGLLKFLPQSGVFSKIFPASK